MPSVDESLICPKQFIESADVNWYAQIEGE